MPCCARSRPRCCNSIACLACSQIVDSISLGGYLLELTGTGLCLLVLTLSQFCSAFHSSVVKVLIFLLLVFFLWYRWFQVFHLFPSTAVVSHIPGGLSSVSVRSFKNSLQSRVRPFSGLTRPAARLKGLRSIVRWAMKTVGG